MKILKTLIVAVVGAMLASCTHFEAPSQKALREQRPLAPKLIRSIEAAEEIELIAIDPKQPTSIAYVFPDQPRALERWRILGRRSVTARDDIHHLAESLGQAIRGGDGGLSPCFTPHHALRFMKEGREVLAIICFDCFFVEIYGIDGLEGVDLALNSSAELETWNRLFRKYGLSESKEANQISEVNKPRAARLSSVSDLNRRP